MSFLSHLLGFEDDDDDDQEWTITNERERTTRPNPHPPEIYDQETGLTKHERAVFEAWLLHGLRDGAKELGMNKWTFKTIVANAKNKLDMHGDHNTLYREYKETYGEPTNTHDYSQDFQTSMTNEEHQAAYPHLYDHEGNYIG